MANATEKKVPFLKKVTPYDTDGVKDQISFVLGNGLSVVVTRDMISAENAEHAMWHGISQKLGDSCAGFSKESKFGDAFAELTELATQLSQKEWNKVRDGKGGVEAKQNYEDLVEALAKLKKMDAADIRVAVDRAPIEKLKGWMANLTVKAEMLEIKSRRAKAAVKGNKTIDDIVFDEEETEETA